MYRIILGNLNYTIEFTTYKRLKNYPGIGKSYPLTTQCVIREKDYIEGIGEVVLHVKDEKNDLQAIRGSLKKAISSIDSKYIRSVIFNRVIKEYLERVQQTSQTD